MLAIKPRPSSWQRITLTPVESVVSQELLLGGVNIELLLAGGSTLEELAASFAEEFCNVADDVGASADDAGSVAEDAGATADEAGSAAEDAGATADEAGSAAEDAGAVADDEVSTGVLIDFSEADESASTASLLRLSWLSGISIADELDVFCGSVELSLLLGPSVGTSI